MKVNVQIFTRDSNGKVRGGVITHTNVPPKKIKEKIIAHINDLNIEDLTNVQISIQNEEEIESKP